MFKHILVPLDGSQLAETALEPALALAQRFGSKITLLRVAEPIFLPTASADGIYVGFMINMRQKAYDEAVAYLQDVRRKLENEGHAVAVHITDSKPPADAILDIVEAAGVDTIVMSTHGRGGLKRWVYGSVANKVLQYAHVPVLLIRVQPELLLVELPIIESIEDMRAHEPMLP